MKKIIVIAITFIIVCLSCFRPLSGATKTGHEDFLDIFFEGDGRLINQLSEEDVSELSSSIKRKAFGWKTTHIQYNRKVKYDGKILFSKSNKTQIPFEFEYKLLEEEVKTKSVSVNGSVSAKITGAIEKIKMNITGSGGSDIEYENENVTNTEMTTFIQMNVMPGKRITMITSGDAYVTSGYSKFFIFGITVRKGLWETVDVETVYYELREEEA